jgi:hypothetical protein
MKSLKFLFFAKVVFASLFIATMFTSCGDDDDTTPVVQVEDGIYVKGTATAFPELNAKALMKSTNNEIGQAPRASLYELYIPIKKDGTFNLVSVAGTTKKTWGPASTFKKIADVDLNIDEPKKGLWKGEIIETTSTFTVPEDGLYHVVFDSELGFGAIAKVEWGVIGAATPGGWGGSTPLTPSAFNTTKMTFESKDAKFTKADWKFRYSDGWKILLSPEVNINTNFGGTVDALAAGGGNFSNAIGGLYTISLTQELGASPKAVFTKTADLPAEDFSNVELGLIGEGLNINGAIHNWSETVMVQKPAKSGDVYTYTFNNVELNNASGFKIREGQTWDKKSYGYPQVKLAGTGAADLSDDGGNFKGAIDKAKYDMTFVIDAKSDTYTFTVNKK